MFNEINFLTLDTFLDSYPQKSAIISDKNSKRHSVPRLFHNYTKTSAFITGMTWTEWTTFFLRDRNRLRVYPSTNCFWLERSSERQVKLYQNSKCGKCWHLSNRAVRIKIIKANLYEKFSKTFVTAGSISQAREFLFWKWDIAQNLHRTHKTEDSMFWCGNFQACAMFSPEIRKTLL